MARALYIHWPFCVAKCPYCDFNSHVRDTIDSEAFAQALLADLVHEASATAFEPLTSIFFGGGTPSLMPPQVAGRLIEKAGELWGFDREIEITLEANPSSVEAANFAALAAAGVNRVSLGLQALDDETLRFLGRLHGVDEGLAALGVAQEAFARVNFDLIYARPGQTTDEWEAELSRALALGTGHMSLYQLTIEPGTRFATLVRQGHLVPLDDDEAGDMYRLTNDMMEGAGLPAYEISNYARPVEESRHNLAYWRYQDYVGIGPGAHGRRNGFATQRHRKPENWLAAVSRNGHGLSEERALGIREQASEALLMGLRLAKGIDLTALAARFGLARPALLDLGRLAFYRDLGMVWEQDGRVGITATAMPLLDGLLAELVPEELVTP